MGSLFHELQSIIYLILQLSQISPGGAPSNWLLRSSDMTHHSSSTSLLSGTTGYYKLTCDVPTQAPASVISQHGSYEIINRQDLG